MIPFIAHGPMPYKRYNISIIAAGPMVSVYMIPFIAHGPMACKIYNILITAAGPMLSVYMIPFLAYGPLAYKIYNFLIVAAGAMAVSMLVCCSYAMGAYNVLYLYDLTVIITQWIQRATWQYILHGAAL
jgi:hypothetical protein